jgi:uncharacterized repeat protein (TIGR01451 family)
MIKHTHNTGTTRAGGLARALAALALVLLMQSPALGAGTAAGTVITNQAYADYQDPNGNDMTRVFSNSVTTIVSQVAGVDVVPATSSKVGAANSTVMYLLEIFNTGNGNDVYDFAYAVTAGWTPTAVQFYHDVNNNHTFDAGTDPIVSSPYVTGTVAADDDFDVFMFVTVPAGAADNSQSVIRVTATSRFDGTVTDFGVYTITVSSAVVTAIKSHVPSRPKPGDTVTYTLTLTNSGTANASNIVVTDAIPGNMTFVPGSISISGVSKTDAADADTADYNATTAGAVTVSLGTLNSGGSATSFSFQARVNAAVAANTAITNQASINYNSGLNALSSTSNGDTLFVGTNAAAEIAATTTSASADPGDTVTYAFTVTNNGNDSDTFDLTTGSSRGWTWTIWVDANGDGIAGNDGDYRLTDSDGDGVIDTGSLTAGQSLSLLAVATVPAGTPDRAVDVLTITATSSNDTAISDSQSFSTTITSPVLTLSKTVTPAGSQPPGTTLTYTITATNTGTGIATRVVITDVVPANTTYVAGSILTGPTVAGLTARTDANDGDGALYDSGTDAVIVGAAGNESIGPGGTLLLRFSVTIN